MSYRDYRLEDSTQRRSYGATGRVRDLLKRMEFVLKVRRFSVEDPKWVLNTGVVRFITLRERVQIPSDVRGPSLHRPPVFPDWLREEPIGARGTANLTGQRWSNQLAWGCAISPKKVCACDLH